MLQILDSLFRKFRDEDPKRETSNFTSYCCHQRLTFAGTTMATTRFLNSITWEEVQKKGMSESGHRIEAQATVEWCSDFATMMINATSHPTGLTWLKFPSHLEGGTEKGNESKPVKVLKQGGGSFRSENECT